MKFQEDATYQSVLSLFKEQFGKPIYHVFAPGRANIIGEHTDYNQGYVLPFAIPYGIHFFIRQNGLKKWRIWSHDLSENWSISLDQKFGEGPFWVKFFTNVLKQMVPSNFVGLDVVFGGNLPIGAGMSSSSALTCGMIAGVNVIQKIETESMQMVNTASLAEHGVGVKGGKMDQIAICMGKQGHALFIDCEYDRVKYVPLNPNEYNFYLIDSGQSHELIDSEYNDRRSECEAALLKIKAFKGQTKTYKNISSSDVLSTNLNDTLTKRALYVVEENQRVLKAVNLLSKGNLEDLGELLNDTHEGLSKLFEVSTSEIDFLCQKLRQIKRIVGCRMMGGGFGGSIIALSRGHISSKEWGELNRSYFNQTKLECKVYPIEPVRGLAVTILES